MTQAPPKDIDNSQELTRNLFEFWTLGARAMTTLAERADVKPSPLSAVSEIIDAATTAHEISKRWAADPVKLSQKQGELANSYVQLCTNLMQRFFNVEVQPVITPEPSDNRFKDPQWSQNIYFDFWKQAYLLTTQWAEQVLHETEGLDEVARQKANWHFRSISSALSPSNCPLTNPEVMRETLASNARNLVQGMEHFVEDLERSGDLLKISQTDTTAFEVGRNLDSTPGKVIFQNDIIQLIQYTPTTEKVRLRPLLIVPPWINKFYILDLTPPKSLISYLVKQGFTVFTISWVNPDQRLSHKSFEDYMREGILAAADAVRRETNVEQCNVVGYCVGGTLLATTLAYLAARSEAPFASASFLTTQVDFKNAGDLLLLAGEPKLSAIDAMMAKIGYLDGSRMANMFNMMRPRDLIWPYVVNNYLLGKKPFAFDILYWNQDSTRMAATNHSFYLREFYGQNRLAQGELVFAGQELDMQKVTLPVFELATKEDHIAPAKSVYAGALLFGGPVEFVLAGSGHVAGVINPPDKTKYQFWTSSNRSQDLEGWLASAKETPGSWWPYWAEWLSRQSGEWTAPREPGLELGVVEEAPGSYVKTSS